MFATREAYEENQRRLAAAYLNPTAEAAMQWWDPAWGLPRHENVLIASLHYGRLRWEHSTPEMIEESKRWLTEHGYRLELNLIPRARQ